MATLAALSSRATSTFTGVIPSGTISAFIGTPPVTEKDYYIAQFLLYSFGLKTDPALGAFLPPLRPENYVFESHGPGIIRSMVVSIVVMSIVTGLRLGVRVFRQGLAVGWDDVMIIPGVLLALTWPTLQICAVVYGGAGKHMFDVTYEQYGKFKLFANIDKAIFFLAVGFVKLSICLFNRRLTSLTSRGWLIFNNCFIVLLVIYLLISLFWNIFQCDPPYAGWDAIRVAKELGHKANCTSDTIVGSSLSVIHVIMDFGLLSVPLIVLWKVRMGWSTKIRLYIVFSIGAMSAVGSVVRQIEQEHLKTDILWNFVALQNWTLVDLTFGVVAASLPILSAFIPSKWTSTAATSNDPNTPRSRYYKSSGHAKLNSGGRENYNEGVNSEENITRTDVIELTFQDKKNSSWAPQDDEYHTVVPEGWRDNHNRTTDVGRGS